MIASQSATATPPAGFIVDSIGGTWNEVVGVANLPDGRLLGWERGGRIYMMSANGTRIPEPVLDIHDEVGAWRDFGLLGLAVDPEFPARPYIYLLYVVDRHHLRQWGTGNYNANTDEYFAATIGRLTRYTLDAATNYTKALTASRLVLLGESASTGLPICHQSHSVGSLLFGTDQTLLVSMGDSASYNQVDLGGQVSDGYITQALADGILKSKENVGAFRAQLVDSHCGKILRIDPDTGDGIASNPFFDATAPRAPRSRVFALGLRNPYRCTLWPETGSHDPADANPGVISTGDVGWTTWEEMSIIDGPGKNLGWPLFEGIDHQSSYAVANVANQDVPNPDAGGTCTQPFMYFRDLLRQATNSTAPQFFRPCAVAQAEDAVANNAPVVSADGGFTGAGYRDIGSGTTPYIEWTIMVPATGSYQIAFRYANIGPGDRPQTILVDGVVAQSVLSFPSTDAWSSWRVSSTAALSLTAGSRTIRMRPSSSGGPNIDCMWLSQASSVPTLPASIATFTHTRPAIDWQHGSNARTPGFSANGASNAVVVGSAGGSTGATFGGNCAVAGPQVHFKSWPAAWHARQFIADYGGGWIRSVAFDSSNRVVDVATFDAGLTDLVGVFADPVNEAIYAPRFNGALLRYRWLPGGSQSPTARMTATPQWGPSPLAVQLNATTSSDPENSPLTYRWQFGDGTADATTAIAAHTFTAPTSAPAGFTVTLTVTDLGGASDSTTIVIGPNNSPPTVDITSLFNGQFYPLDQTTIFPLLATVTDAQHTTAQIMCRWQTTLHHNTHIHPEPADPSCIAQATISALGCGSETYFYDILFTATDAAGLSAAERVYLYPDCNGSLQCPSDLDHNQLVDGGDLSTMLANWNGSGVGDLNSDGIVDGGDLATMLAAWGVCP